ncbi:uncharacterized protein JCM6883_004177 [Sporobolomyces salmoneus]|uniref:uncharacterized protein n=1 Tax=Sporobolomyces salmoneus TaxID=183962 RepID=UPI00316B3699
MLRSVLPTLRTTVIARRSFASTSIARESSPLDSVKQTADKVNKVVGDAAAKGIETVEGAVNAATGAVKGETGSLSAEAQKAGADLKNTAQKAGSEAQATFNKGKIDLEQAAKDVNGPKN